MIRPRSLVARFMAFLAIVVAALATGSFFIVESASRAGLEQLFRSQLDRAPDVVAQYASGSRLVRARELETVLGSPRFLAALEIGDPATIAGEIPTHSVFADAGFVVVADEAGEVLWGTDSWEEQEVGVRRLFRRIPDEGFQRAVLETDGGPLELVATNVRANNGLTIGCVAVGSELSGIWAEDLRALTGFDVYLVAEDRVIGASTPDHSPSDPSALVSLPPGVTRDVRLGDRRVIACRVDEADTGLRVVLTASVDEAVAPFVARFRRLLALLGIAAAAVGLALLYLFASRHVGRQVNRLVDAADRIARGNLDVPIAPGGGDELGVLARGLDRMRLDLRRQREELEAAHESRIEAERMATVGQMAAGIVHDFKNPMAVVMGTADLIEERHPGDARLTKQCGVIRGQVERMVALTRDLLDYSRGEAVLEPEVVQLADWIREVGEAQEEPFRRAGVGLALGGPDGVQVRIDPGRMRRVLDNLLNNAREVSREGGRVSVRWKPGEAGDVVVEVVDQGPGIPPGIRDRLFEPFVTSGKAGGSGLGLAVSRRIVEDHGARIEATDAPEGGARFAITFPAGRRVTATEGKS